MRERHKVRHQERRNSSNHREDKEFFISHEVTDKPADRSRQHHPQVHNARGKSVMRHLMLARSHLLHHEQRQTHEAETVTEVLQYNRPTNQQPAFRLIDSQQRICHKRQIEKAAQREQCFPQSAMRNVITRQQRAQHKSRRP